MTPNAAMIATATTPMAANVTRSRNARLAAIKPQVAQSTFNGTPTQKPVQPKWTNVTSNKLCTNENPLHNIDRTT